MLLRISFLIFMLPLAVVGQVRIDQDSLIAKIFALDPVECNLEKMERYFAGDTTEIYSPGAIVIFPLDVDTFRFVAMVNWGPEGTRGILTNFYLFDRLGPTLKIVATTTENSVMIYGGGSQKFGDIAFSKYTWDLWDNVIGFEVNQNSYHMASNSENESVSLYAIAGDRIEKVMEVSSSGFINLDLDYKNYSDPARMDNLLENLQEYVPRAYDQDCICEYHRTLEVLTSSQNRRCDIGVNVIKYQLLDRKIIRTSVVELYQWNGSQYELTRTVPED